jgi:hypothetical protein
MDNINELHDVDQLILFYQTFGNSTAEDVHEQFEEIQEIAQELDLLRNCFQQPGTVTVFRPPMDDPNLSFLHQVISDSSMSFYAIRHLCHHSVRQFYRNFTLQDVNGISSGARMKKSKVTLLELVIVLNRMLDSQARNIDYPDIFEQDLPYRSRSWVLNLIESLESDYIGQRCLSDEFRHLNLIVGRFMTVMDFYEVTLHANEMRALNNLNLGDGRP